MITEACAKAAGNIVLAASGETNFGTYHHNLIAHNDSRNPRWASGCGYNRLPEQRALQLGIRKLLRRRSATEGRPANPPIEFSTINMVANYYKPGPARAAT